MPGYLSTLLAGGLVAVLLGALASWASVGGSGLASRALWLVDVLVVVGLLLAGVRR
jgi:hypothetical protein